MHTDHTIASVRNAVATWRRDGRYVAFVPTMGNLHDGHMRLVERARQIADRVVVSVFVNPLQFGPGEDLARYPRTPEEDAVRLAEAGVDLVFAPDETEMYPRGAAAEHAVIDVPPLSAELEGATRPGHFAGVATVVAKLFNIVQPHAAVFGEKDYQQLLVIRRMAADLCLPVEIVGVPTAREADGLALSSRNAYLGPAERDAAPALYRGLQGLASRLATGERDFPTLEDAARGELANAGMEPDYVAVRRAADLGAPTPDDRELVVLGAARLGTTRLIDNVPVTVQT